nr:hypothetical protein [Sphingomonas sp.]
MSFAQPQRLPPVRGDFQPQARIRLGDGEQMPARRAGDALADGDEAPRDHAGDGRADVRRGQPRLALAQRGAGGGDLHLRGVHRVACALRRVLRRRHLAVRRHAAARLPAHALIEREPTVDIRLRRLRLAERGLTRVEQLPGLFDRFPKRRLIEPGEDIPLAHRLLVLDRDFADHAVLLPGIDHMHRDGLQPPAAEQPERDIDARDRLGGIFRREATAHETADEDDQHDRGEPDRQPSYPAPPRSAGIRAEEFVDGGAGGLPDIVRGVGHQPPAPSFRRAR